MSLALNIEKTNFPGVFRINGDAFSDERGVFSRLYCNKTFKENEISWTINQMSLSQNPEVYTLRGFHMQIPPHEEDKLVTCLSGKIYDVIIDLRKDSETYLQWESFELDSKKRDSIIIPKGCANAWQTLEKNTTVLYAMSEAFSAGSYTGVRYNDPLFNINWPHPPSLISKKDAEFPNYKPLT